MSSLFDSIKAWKYKPSRRMGITIDEEIRVAKLLTSLISRLPYNKVLEIGCGNCLVSSMVKKYVKSIIAIDTWGEEITYYDIKDYTKDVDINLIANLFPLPFRDESFDLAYAVLYFYNRIRKDRKELAKEVSRVIKNNGYFILIEPEIIRNMRRDFQSFKEVGYFVDQGIFFSIMEKLS
jgi:ubiquinone/menaquinone biosynthesis C-methylase UbiE